MILSLAVKIDARSVHHQPRAFLSATDPMSVVPSHALNYCRHKMGYQIGEAVTVN